MRFRSLSDERRRPPIHFRAALPRASSEKKVSSQYKSNCLTICALILKQMLNQPPDLDRLFHALSDPARRAMVERLTRGPAPVSELARPLAMSLPSVLQHLGVLEAAGIVRSEKVGRVRTCSIEAGALSLAEQWINARRIEWENRLDRLGDYLKTLEKKGDGDVDVSSE
jgi:DNA-binding transcriptional ArsR family regulator